MSRCCSLSGRVALFGLGGVGKSQLAIEFAHRMAEAHNIWVFWIYAGTQERVEEGFRTIADTVKLAGRMQPKADIPLLVQNWLTNEGNGRWLIILDSADDREVLYHVYENHNQRALATYLPESRNGSIVVTTRSRDLAYKLTGNYKNIIEIGPMAHKDALTLLEKKLGQEHYNASGAEDLVHVLDYIPLAISQAAAYIQARARASIEQYLADFQSSEQKKVELLERDAGGMRRDRVASSAVLATWQLSFDYIRSYQRSAANLLSFMSLFDCQGIPERVLKSFTAHTATQGGSLDKFGNLESKDIDSDSDNDKSNGFEEDISILRDYCLIAMNKEKDKFEIHGLVQLSMKKWLQKFGQEVLQTLKQQYIERMAASFPTGEYENWSACRELFAHLQVALDYEPNEDKLKEWATLCCNGGHYALLQGRYSIAKQMADKANWACGKMLRRDDTLILKSTTLLASVVLRNGQWGEAEKLQMQVVAASKTILGPDHEDTLKSMSDLALVYYRQGHFQEAEKLWMQVTEAMEMTLEFNHPETLKNMDRLASAYHSQGRWKEAEKLRIQVKETRKMTLGFDHPDTLKSMGNLASSYHSQGRWEEAEKLEEDVMKTHIITFGRHHPDTLKSIGNLALTYSGQGYWEKAKMLQVQAMEGYKITLGPDHPDTLKSIGNYASTLLNQGLWGEAETLQLQVLEAQLINPGVNHPDTLRTMANCVITVSKQGQWEAAEELQVQVVDAYKDKHGPEHQDTLKTIVNLALIYKNQGQHTRALALMKDCLVARQQVLGPEHPETRESLALAQEWIRNSHFN